MLVYTLNGFCSAVAGVVFSLYMLSGYGLHCLGMELDVIAAVVIGGTLLAGGTGIAPIKAMLEMAVQSGMQRELHVYWGSRHREGLYALDAIAVVGAIVLVGEKKSTFATVLGVIAIVAATSNVVGGFLITDRMLKMFKTSRSSK